MAVLRLSFRKTILSLHLQVQTMSKQLTSSWQFHFSHRGSFDRLMQISEAVNILLDLYYSSHDSQPHSINVRNFFNIIRGDLPTSPKISFLFVVVVCSLVSNAIRLFALGAMGFACRLFFFSMVPCGSSPVARFSRSLLPYEKRSAWAGDWNRSPYKPVYHPHSSY